MCAACVCRSRAASRARAARHQRRCGRRVHAGSGSRPSCGSYPSCCSTVMLTASGCLQAMKQGRGQLPDPSQPYPHLWQAYTLPHKANQTKPHIFLVFHALLSRLRCGRRAPPRSRRWQIRLTAPRPPQRRPRGSSASRYGGGASRSLLLLCSHACSAAACGAPELASCPNPGG